MDQADVQVSANHPIKTTCARRVELASREPFLSGRGFPRTPGEHKTAAEGTGSAGNSAERRYGEARWHRLGFHNASVQGRGVQGLHGPPWFFRFRPATFFAETDAQRWDRRGQNWWSARMLIGA